MKTQLQHKVYTTHTIQGEYNYINAMSLYTDQFNAIPNLLDVNSIDAEKACHDFIKNSSETISLMVTKHETETENEIEFLETVIVTNNQLVLFFRYNYCEIYYQHEQFEEATKIASSFRKHKQRRRRKPLEINLIVQSNRGLSLSEMEVKRTKLDLDLFYNDDFKEVDQTIRTRLKKNNDKGIILLHGLPGTGKTSYLRYLIGKINKKVMFLPPNIASCMTDPQFINLLIDHPNSVIIIEDAENIIMDRSHSSNSSVSNLLNISDGLLSDFLNVQLICTFNSSLTLVDKALMRKGRLIAKYEFGKLGVEKAKRLSQHFGHDMEINEAMTIAELSNPHEPVAEEPTKHVIGFKRHVELYN